jgi:HAD superfamily hydrolase (TIGR01459 family)
MGLSQPSPRLIGSIKEIAQEFDLFLIDQFGVLHDGTKPIAGATCLLDWLRQQGKPVVVLSNSAKPAKANEQRLAALGIATGLFERVLTSGDLARRDIAAGRLPAPFRRGARVLVVGREGDDYQFDSAGLRAVQAGEACDFVLFAGSSAPEISMEAYRHLLAAAAKAGTPALCCNPDLTMLTPSGPQPGCGALGQLYQNLGGTVLWVGKPEVSFFEDARLLFAPTPARRTLVIGDSLDHDILGARRAGYRSALVRTGVHQHLRHDELLMHMKKTAAPDFVLRSLM